MHEGGDGDVQFVREDEGGDVRYCSCTCSSLSRVVAVVERAGGGLPVVQPAGVLLLLRRVVFVAERARGRLLLHVVIIV